MIEYSYLPPTYLNMTILTIIGLLLLLLLICAVMIYNQLVKKKNLMKEGWSGIDVYLKKRYDLIPNLIETVKGYATHEQQLMENITRLRSTAIQSSTNQEKIVAENGLSQSIGQLMILAENYPDLKANTNFQQLQSQLETIESEIEMSRRYYNGTVRENNILIESFPSNLLANAFNFQQGAFFEIQHQEERENKNISF
ncbi:LemA protein [Pedobacter caeni]|uniref:LemA protein n=2 Tax=Pedobacter caeni TaxID=288992 RepID=A0A1M5JH50_9SPHI|nr:LemA protein [Pedobacter caeni]